MAVAVLHHDVGDPDIPERCRVDQRVGIAGDGGGEQRVGSLAGRAGVVVDRHRFELRRGEIPRRPDDGLAVDQQLDVAVDLAQAEGHAHRPRPVRVVDGEDLPADLHLPVGNRDRRTDCGAVGPDLGERGLPVKEIGRHRARAVAARVVGQQGRARVVASRRWQCRQRRDRVGRHALLPTSRAVIVQRVGVSITSSGTPLK